MPFININKWFININKWFININKWFINIRKSFININKWFININKCWGFININKWFYSINKSFINSNKSCHLLILINDLLLLINDLLILINALFVHFGLLDLVPAHCCEPGPLWSHRNSFSLNIVCFPSPGIFIAMHYRMMYRLPLDTLQFQLRAYQVTCICLEGITPLWNVIFQ